MYAREHTFSVWLGYDPSLLVQLSTQARVGVARVAEAWLFGAFCLSLPLGYVFFLLTHQVWLGTLVSAGICVFLVNLLRLAVAGGGAAASDAEATVRARSPSFSPVLWFALFGLLLAQPAQLVFLRAELDPLVERARVALASQHDHSLAALRTEQQALGDVPATDHYNDELSRCEFLVLRLCGLWSRPAAATRFSLIFLAIVLLPALVARAHGRSALADYELARWRAQRALITQHTAITERRVAAALSAFAGHVPRPPRAPFEQARPDPLAMSWRIAHSARPRSSLRARFLGVWRRGGDA